ncbi:hypothetical protein PanWU01x14_100660 [Parasponia andersonii]|uniref:Uncharacterized protein n=1 Tax=Parasponia andersonii TaxID=3476 RepID=A0A2P5D2Y3_PARAD|nr:hypothetical protein PanWU01x14_100660 [Parasponia andersonii]
MYLLVSKTAGGLSLAWIDDGSDRFQSFVLISLRQIWNLYQILVICVGNANLRLWKLSKIV